MTGRPIVCDRAFSAMARPILPLPSSNGWMDSKYKCAIAERSAVWNESANLPIYQVSMKIWKLNRVLPLIDITQVGFGANTFNKMQAVGLVILDAGDQFYATVSQNSGSTLLLNDTEGLTYISGHKVN